MPDGWILVLGMKPLDGLEQLVFWGLLDEVEMVVGLRLLEKLQRLNGPKLLGIPMLLPGLKVQYGPTLLGGLKLLDERERVSFVELREWRARGARRR